MFVLSVAGVFLGLVVLGSWLVTHPGLSPGALIGPKKKQSNRATWQTNETASPVFLFENGRLTQANAAAWRILGKSQSKDRGWRDVQAALAEIVPGIPVSLKSLREGDRVYPEQNEPLAHHLSIEHHPPFTRVELQLGEMPLRQSPGPECMEAPFPVWAQDEKGALLWSNRAYKKAGFNPRLTETLRTEIRSKKRFSVPAGKGKPPAHFRLLTKNIGNSFVHYAHSAEDLVAAETSRQDVVQTLGKTFAQLSTGLVVFDNDRNLVLFNPAVMDLFGFSASFLSARPSMESFFDHMRDNRMIPEPKNYSEWRTQLADRVTGLAENHFRENWQLPSGATIRATGLPNPDGGVGFLFEDISSQVSTTRRFRDELALSHTLLDSLDEALAVVDALGRVVFANKAFQTHWKVDPDSSFADFTVSDLMNALRRDISADHIEQISTFLNQADPVQDTSIPCMKFEDCPTDLHLTRARGQLVILRHAVPSKLADNQTTILAS